MSYLEGEEKAKKNYDLFYKNEDLPLYLCKIRQCRNTYDESYKYERRYFARELDKRLKDVAFQKIMEIGTSDLVKARAYYDAAMEYDTIEEAFRGFTSDGWNSLDNNSILEKINNRIPSVISDVLDCLVDIIEDPDIFELFVRCDNIASNNTRISEFRTYLENNLIFNEDGKLPEHIIEEIREELENYKEFINPSPR